jgi:hypothetical protein
MSALTLVVADVGNQAERWQHWRQGYADSSRTTARHMRTLFVTAIVLAVANVARSLLS